MLPKEGEMRMATNDPMTAVNQTGAVFTVALRKLAEGWRIVAWAWAKGIRA
jgi:hypothetical protein